MKRFLDFLEQYSNVNFQPCDFQDETDSTVVVRERTKGSKLESAFAKKSGKIVAETTHTSLCCQKRQKEETFSQKEMS